MKLSNAGCAFLAPALSSAVAFAMPEPTQLFAVVADNWSPAPTTAPRFMLLAREDDRSNASNTCGYASGSSASPISCPASQICATNTYFGVHGCCPSSNLSACTIATTCIPSSAMSASCTDSLCSTDAAIAKCTASSAQECYKYLFDYGTTTMTQNGCTARAFTSTIPRSYGLSTPTVVITVTAPPVTSPTPPPASSYTPSTTPQPASAAKQLGPIIGGTVGGCLILSAVALAAFLIHRRRLKTLDLAATQPPPVSGFHNPEFDPNGFPTPAAGWTQHDVKTWKNGDALAGPFVGVSEVHGNDRAVEVEAREKKSGAWSGVGVCEVEAPLGRGKGGVVEAP